MVQKNMTIWDSIRRKQKEDLIIKSILWKTIIDVFKKEKNIDIEKYLVSIKINWKKIKVKTNKSVINYELKLLNEKIANIFQRKLENIWIRIIDIEIKYI